MKQVPYNRARAVAYAHRWAYERNPKYAKFDNDGGDCTNFASQVLFAGSRVMNPDKRTGWYYVNVNDRSPSWAGVVQLYDFLVHNQGVGPYAEEVSLEQAQPGDLVQLRYTQGDRYRHTPVIVSVGEPGDTNAILVAAHSLNADNRPLSSYVYLESRLLHICGVRK